MSSNGDKFALEHLNLFVSSRGILRSCDLFGSSPRSSHITVDQEFDHKIHSASSVYLCTDAVFSFAKGLFQKVNHQIVLVTGDSDLAIDQELLNEPDVAAMLASPLIKHWWAQNCGVHHLKLSPMPIGNDYHTIWEHPGVFSHERYSPVAQENLMLRVLASSPPVEQRFITAHCNWLPTIDRGDRQECFDSIDKSVALIEPQRTSREVSWSRQVKCMFVLSPEGAGMDCHRTWEALMLGCVPIVRRNALAPLFANLPVWIVDQWSEVTAHNMEQFALKSLACTYDFSSLFLRHWQDRIHGRPNPFQLDPMTRAEFHSLLVGGTVSG